MKKRIGPPRVFVCSPLRGTGNHTDVESNKALARKLCHLACLSGFAPFAPHLFYTQFLDDGNPSQRLCGIGAGLSFMSACEEVWVFTQAGISEGMRKEIAVAENLGIKVVMDPPAWGNVDD